MAKTPDPGPSYPFSAIMKDFDPTRFNEEFEKFIKQYQLPGVDINALVANERKNMEALTDANRVAFEGLQAIARRQGEILKNTMDEVTKAVEAISKSDSPPEAAAKQAELAKNAFEKALSNMRELAEMVAKSNEDAADTMSTRLRESLDEMKNLAIKLKAQ
jgi:phasin family protein